MPTCKNCGKHFPNAMKIDGKKRILNKRKYCFDCSPFGLHNTRPIPNHPNIPNYGEGPKPTSDPYIFDCKCHRCGREYQYNKKNRQGHGLTICNSCRVNTRRFEIGRKAIEYKGGKCERCGYSKCDAALEFHHISPDFKDFGIGSNRTRSWGSIRAELDKCIMLCANCHRELHYDKVVVEGGVEPPTSRL